MPATPPVPFPAAFLAAFPAEPLPEIRGSCGTGASSGVASAPPPEVRVSLVGAGPGAPDLITLRGANRLRAADIVIHDCLVSPELLTLCRPDAEIIPAGKRAGQHHVRQETINALLLEKAATGLRVVRLKGGDPLVFGRGGEEARVLAAAGVAFEIVPGVTAACAAGAAARVPLTHRGLAAGVLFLAGHGSHAGAVDWPRIAALRGVTLCIYMGARSLRETARKLLDNGMPGETPLAVVAQASLPGEIIFRSTLGGVAAGTGEGPATATEKGAGMGTGMGTMENLPTPALVLVGDVVGGMV